MKSLPNRERFWIVMLVDVNIFEIEVQRNHSLIE